jgi:hypothetical protein
MDSSDWLNGMRYHTFDTRPGTEFNGFCPMLVALVFRPKREWAFWRTVAFVVREINGCFSYFPTKKFARNVNGDFLFLWSGLL